MTKNNDVRYLEIKKMAGQYFGGKDVRIQSISGDASQRRYFRLILGRQNFIVMDAPPEHNSNDKFIRNTELFKNVSVPKIYFKDEEKGLFILEDLGKETLFSSWNKKNELAEYQKAIMRLIEFQKISQPEVVTSYSNLILETELNYFKEWYREKYLRKPFSKAEEKDWRRLVRKIVEMNLRQVNVYVHRDYHSKNLMIKNGEIRIIDHQDTLYGPITYDLVSLLKDAYVELTSEQQDQLVDFYRNNSHFDLPDKKTLVEDFDIMGLQRHLKILGIFARLSLRDGKNEYVKHIPLIKKYISEVAYKYNWLVPVIDLIDA